MDQIIEIAKKVHEKSYAREFKGTVKQVLGTALSVGCTIDNKSPKEITAAVEAGEIEVS